MFTVALMQPAPPRGIATESSDSLAGNTSKPSAAKLSIMALVFAQSPEESLAPAMTVG
ncbi:hypothetical protein D9M68_972860 [compost metagenome]